MKKIIQNAIQIPPSVTGGVTTILSSRHVHDFVEHANYAVDGGLEYARRLKPENAPDPIDLTLYEDSTIDECVEKMIWGTYGKDGKSVRTFIYLKTAETDHLKRILQIINNSPKNNFSIKMEMTINKILKNRDTSKEV